MSAPARLVCVVDDDASVRTSLVRLFRSEVRCWRDGIIPGSTTIFLGDLPGRVWSLDQDTTWIVVCRSGMRAAIGGSVLARAGIRSEVIGAGGVPDWLARHAPARVALFEQQLAQPA